MNKNWKIVLMVVVMLFTAIFTITDVNATNTIKLTSKSYIKAGGRNHAWFKTNAGYAYCITPKKTGPSVGTKMHLDKEITGTSGNVLYYMLKNDNPSNKNNYVYTQAAIWRYYNNYVPYKSGSTVISKSKTIVSKAKASKATPKRVGITVVNKSGSMSISSDNKYYQSGKFTIKTTSGTKYTASVSGKAYIVNVSGNKQTTFNSGDSFYVRVNDADVTKSLTFTITIKTSGTNEYVRVYSTGKSSYQKLVLLDSESKSASKQLSVAVTPVKRVCTYVNGKYYGKNGTVVSEATYKDECMPKCEEKDGKYFDDKGNEIDKINYYKICIKPTCEKIDDTYFGKDGSIVTEEEFSNQCIPKCIEKDGKYYDDKGNETDKTTYIKVCKKPICEKVDDTYFGKNGDVVSESEYKKQCVHVCEVYNNQYYGKDGLVVSKETYKDECEHVVVPVPNTGTSLLESLLYIVLGTGIVLGGLGFVGYQNKLSVK